MQIRANLERCDAELVGGWILDSDAPDAKIELEILLGERLVGRCVADRFRPDLEGAGFGDGVCGFYFAMPSFIPRSEAAEISIRIAGTPLYLKSWQNRAARTPPQPAPTTVSRFGGLWIDRNDWLDRLARKHRTGEISEELSVAIFRFVRDGYLVIEGAAPPALVERVNADIERLWQDPPPGLLIETFEPDGCYCVVPADIRYREGRTKLLDIYAFSSAARAAIMAPKVIEFLTAIFEERPKAFQSLHFWNGSQQAMHKDTAYVKIDTNPLHMAASWLALEQVEPGSGELEYFVGSQRAPDFVFGGVSKWMEFESDAHDRFLQSLHDDAAREGHVRRQFLAKPGDALIWHADLAHGGSAITVPGRTRRSLVTHFTTARDEPFYRRNSRFREAETDACVFVSSYADVRTD